jgi:hypothetical protein
MVKKSTNNIPRQTFYFLFKKKSKAAKLTRGFYALSLFGLFA